MAFDDSDDDTPHEDEPSPAEESEGGTNLLDDPDPAGPDVPEPDPLPDPAPQPEAEDAPAQRPEEEPSPVEDFAQPSTDIEVEEREGRIFITGTDQDDTISVPSRAYVTGGEGADTFLVDGASMIGEQAEIMDFNAKEDGLVIVWDDSESDTPPEISLGQIEDAADLSQILVDGVVVAHVTNQGGLSTDDIRLVAASATEADGED